MKNRHFINLTYEDADRPIYRIVSCERFLQILRDQENGLVLPRLWDDPFENFILNGVAFTAAGRRVKIKFRNQLYGQCWSLHRETDLMWRGYSPGRDAVKIKSTVRTLYDSLYNKGGLYRDISCFMGKVQYVQKKRISEVLSRVNLIDPTGVAIAATLLVKRWAFRSEKEVRLIYFRQWGSPSRKIFRYKFDPNSVFVEAVLDPRMQDGEATQWKRRFHAAGFSNKIIQSGLYKPPKGIVLKIR